jgi:MFS family permease
MQKTRSPLYVTTLIAGAFFMENLDGTIIATALPQMARSFHVGAVSLNIGMTAYLLTLAVFIPISGWVADRYGSRSIFAAAIAVFTLASLLCGSSSTLTEFTLMRILQGIGGAMMVPVGTTDCFAHHAERPIGPSHRLHYLAGTYSLGHWTSIGRLHHHLRELALDLLP